MSAPLAERLRPRTIDEYIGQEHLVGKNGVFRKFFETGNVPSFILWGPPGVGKTTLAKIVATQLDRPFFTLSAVTSGVKDVREVIESARKQRFFDAKPPFLFIDEIHRFNKSQQDSLLGAVEQGVVTLIGATTENPSFEVISPLLSRCQVYILKSLEDKDLQTLLDRALTTDTELKARQVEVKQTGALFKFSGGDARKLLNILDILAGATEGKLTITDQYVTDCLQQNIALYDKNGEQHYDVISAFIKSVRGSDPNAAIYYLARMLAGGEEPRFLARRLVILASEDIGLANPNALLLANACFDTVHKIGMPEARITLAETTIYLATSPKSNSAYTAINKAMSLVEHDTTNRPVPLHLRNAPTKLMDKAGYGKGYKYAHDYAGNFAEQEFLPESLAGTKFYEPNTGNATEAKIAQLNLAVGQLCTLPDTQLVDMASFYESEPAYYTDQDPFVNTVVLLRTGLPPKELLGYLHGIENSLGRVRTVENGPRTLDLDILDYQMYVASDEVLTLPHPRVTERDFVVKPLLEILPDWDLADGTPVGSVPEGERVGKARRL